MDKDRLNNMVVDLFHGISYEEEKAVITDEFKDISNKDLHIIDAIGIKKPKNMSTIAGDLNITVGTVLLVIYLLFMSDSSKKENKVEHS